MAHRPLPLPSQCTPQRNAAAAAAAAAPQHSGSHTCNTAAGNPHATAACLLQDVVIRKRGQALGLQVVAPVAGGHRLEAALGAEAGDVTREHHLLLLLHALLQTVQQRAQRSRAQGNCR